MKYEEVSSVYVLKKAHRVILNNKWPTIKETFGKTVNIYDDGKTRLTLKKGTPWDGSTYAIDCEADIEASLVHDWLCYIIDDKLGDTTENWKKYRKMADQEYLFFLKKNGMNFLRAYARYFAIRKFAFLKSFIK
jgi:hypothetical protein